jgi:hypothetical protein
MINDKLKRAEKITPSMSKAAFKYFRDGGGEENFAEENLHKELKKLGWTLLTNEGAASGVYQNSKKPYVLKINRLYDPGYERFVKIIKENPNKHFPNISDMKRLKIRNYSYYVYLIEKLNVIPERYARKYVRKMENFMFGEYEYAGLPTFLEKNPTLVAALKVLAKDGLRGLDLHEGNIMKRSDGTIVIIDPYF